MPLSTGSPTIPAMTLFSEKKDGEIIAFLCNTSGTHPLQQAAVCEIFKRQSKEAQNYQVAWLKNLIITTPRQGNEKKIVLDTITDCQIDLAAVIKENFDPELQAIARMILAINAPVQERRELIAKLPLLLVAKNTHALPTVLLAASFYLPSLSESLFRRCMQLLDKQNPSVAYEAIKGLGVLAPLLSLKKVEACLAVVKDLWEALLQNRRRRLLPESILHVEKILRTMQLRANIAAGADRKTSTKQFAPEKEFKNLEEVCKNKLIKFHVLETYLQQKIDVDGCAKKIISLLKKLCIYNSPKINRTIADLIKRFPALLPCLPKESVDSLIKDFHSDLSRTDVQKQAIAAIIPAIVGHFPACAKACQALLESFCPGAPQDASATLITVYQAMATIAVIEPTITLSCLQALDQAGLYRRNKVTEVTAELGSVIVSHLPPQNAVTYQKNLSAPQWQDPQTTKEVTAIIITRLFSLLPKLPEQECAKAVKTILSLFSKIDISQRLLTATVAQLTPETIGIYAMLLNSTAESAKKTLVEKKKKLPPLLASNLFFNKVVQKPTEEERPQFSALSRHLCAVLTHPAAHNIKNETFTALCRLLFALAECLLSDLYPSPEIIALFPQLKALNHEKDYSNRPFNANYTLTKPEYLPKLLPYNKEFLIQIYASRGCLLSEDYIVHPWETKKMPPSAQALEAFVPALTQVFESSSDPNTKKNALTAMKNLISDHYNNLRAAEFKTLIAHLPEADVLAWLTTLEKSFYQANLAVKLPFIMQRLTIREAKLKCLDITRKNASEQLPLVVANADKTVAPEILTLITQYKNSDAKLTAKLIAAIAAHLTQAQVKKKKLVPMLLSFNNAATEVTEALLALATTFGTETILTLCPKNQFALMAQSFVKEIFAKAPRLAQAARQVNGEESQEEPEQKPSEVMKKIMASMKIAANINLAGTMPPNSDTPVIASTSTAAHLKTHS